MRVTICIVQGLWELLGLIAFVSGYILDVSWLMIAGGILIVLDDIIEMGLGILNPLFPVLFAAILAIIFTPWYVGVFWASGSFKIFGIPTSLMKVFNPKGLLERYQQRKE